MIKQKTGVINRKYTVNWRIIQWENEDNLKLKEQRTNS